MKEAKINERNTALFDHPASCRHRACWRTLFTGKVETKPLARSLGGNTLLGEFSHACRRPTDGEPYPQDGRRERSTPLKITIVDAPCGAGKTEWAISYMNAHPETSFIFATPFLTEVERVKSKTTKQFYDPQNYTRPQLVEGKAGSKSKLQDFNDLLVAGLNIATTHSTFANATKDTINALLDNQYHLILDETVDVLRPLADVASRTSKPLNKEDVALMIRRGIIEVDANCRVRWTDTQQFSDGDEHHAYWEVQRFAEAGNLLLLDGTLFIWELPPELFEAMDKVTILTYRVDGSFMLPYLQIHGIQYEKMSVSGIYGQGFELAPYTEDLEKRKEWKQLITFYDDSSGKDLGRLSATFYRGYVENRPNSAESKALKNALQRYFRAVKAKASDVLWTCPKMSRQMIAPKGYAIARELTAEEKTRRTQAELDDFIDNNGLRCWVASNARATNDYSQRHVLAYMLDLNPNPEISKYFGDQGAPIKRNDFALAGLIQWVWRSAIRRNEPITLWLPSPRMKKLFTAWLDGTQ